MTDTDETPVEEVETDDATAVAELPEVHKMDLGVDVSEIGPCRKHVKIRVPRADIEYHHNDLIREFSGEAETSATNSMPSSGMIRTVGTMDSEAAATNPASIQRSRGSGPSARPAAAKVPWRAIASNVRSRRSSGPAGSSCMRSSSASK